MGSLTIKKIQESIQAITAKSNLRPSVAITLGSGLGNFTERIEEKVEIPYSEIPHFSKTTVTGHQGQLILGKVKGVNVACLAGRIHCYEGHSPQEVVFPTRVMKALGADSLLLSNAAGGMNPNFKSGDLVMITDHINLSGKNPLYGPNEEELGPRFPDMSEAYHPEIQEKFQAAAKKINYSLHSGIYAGVLGPTYETPSEVKMLGILGADMVGMSTVHEVIAANHTGLKVGAISCITNMAAGIEKGKLDHNDIKQEALKVMEIFCSLIETTVEQLA